jgi:hypothetical protein
MRGDRSTARTVGILFIIGSVSAVVGGLLLLPATEAGFIAEAAGNRGQIVTGALLEFVLAISVVAMAALLYPVLKRQHEGSAIAYVGARTLEGVLVLTGTVSALLALSTSEQVAAGGAAPLGAEQLLIAARDWSYWLGPMAMFAVGSVVLNVLLYRGRLVPRWLSTWGGLGAVLLMASALLEMYGVALDGWQAVFTAPIGVQEMVFAVWLIWKGFSTRPIEAEPQAALAGAGV